MGFEPMYRTVTAFGLHHLATATPHFTLIGAPPGSRTQKTCGLNAVRMPVPSAARNWCLTPESNRHVFRHKPLKPARLPVSPVRHSLVNVSRVELDRHRLRGDLLQPLCIHVRSGKRDGT